MKMVFLKHSGTSVAIKTVGNKCKVVTILHLQNLKKRRNRINGT